MLKRTLNTLTAVILVCALCTAAMLPFAGEGAGINPVGSAWAAFSCDADGDGHPKQHRKCEGGDEPVDPDDSDPCNPVPQEGDPTYDSCNDGGGTGTGGDLGAAISLDCTLVGNWDGPIAGETIKGDKLDTGPDGGTRYSDAVDKVDCSIDGPSVPWPIRLGLGVKGRPENSVRKVDVDLGAFEIPENFVTIPGVDSERVDTSGSVYTYLNANYPTLFDPAAEGSTSDFPNMDEMEPIRINVRPYRNPEDNQTEDGIHLLPAGVVYPMGMRFSIPGMERTSFSIASQWYPGNESFTGIGCETGFNQEILDNAPPLIEAGAIEGPSVLVPTGMQDVSVYLWEDGDDADNLPDGYTVSTGTIVDLGVEGPPGVNSAAPLYAAVCSSIGPDTCGNPRAPSNCNFLGYVPVQFTMHARVK
jgi:hypothetical protein